MQLHESITAERVMDAVKRGTFGLDNPGFCTECGAMLPQACAHCGFANKPSAKFCGGYIEDAIKVAGLEGEMEAIDLCELIDQHLVVE